MDKDPFSYGWVTYLYVSLLALLGGSVKYLQEDQCSGFWECSKVFLKEAVTAVFVGLVVFWLCIAYGMDQIWTAISIAISSHMGVNALNVITAIWKRVLNSKSGGKE